MFGRPFVTDPRVKGEDLLFLEHANIRLNDEIRQAYLQVGPPVKPSASVGFYSTPTPDEPTGRTHVAGSTSGIDRLWWTLHESCTGQLLPYVFTDAEDERNQYTDGRQPCRRPPPTGRAARWQGRRPPVVHVGARPSRTWPGCRAGRIRL